MSAHALQNGSERVETSLPRRVTVSELLTSRYESGKRPASWEKRVAGMDTIRTPDGEELSLLSDGQQSPPQTGWVILLTDAEESGYRWTLYGMPGKR
jgi:hypothetical protein